MVNLRDYLKSVWCSTCHIYRESERNDVTCNRSITGMGGRPFRLRVLPITGMGGRPGRCPVFLRVLPVIITGRLPFFPFVSQVVLLVLRSFLADITHIAFDVKCSTTTSTDPRNQICKLQRSILTFSMKY